MAKWDKALVLVLLGVVTFWIAELYVPAVFTDPQEKDLPHSARHRPVIRRQGLPSGAAAGAGALAASAGIFDPDRRGNPILPGDSARAASSGGGGGLFSHRVVDVVHEDEDEEEEDGGGADEEEEAATPNFISTIPRPKTAPARRMRAAGRPAQDAAALGKALKAARVTPSPALQTALSDYEELHRAVLRDPARAAAAKYIVYVSGGNDGYGNRLPGLASAFVWAVISGRVLLVHWQDTYKEPAAFGELFDPGFEMDCLKVDIPKVRSLIDKQKKIAAVKGKAALVYRDAFKELATKDLNRQYPEGVVLFKSDDWPLPLLANNPNHAQEIARIFGRSNVFGHVARFLLKPAAPLARRADAVVQNKFSDYVVGCHLRLTKPMPAGGSKGKKVPDPEVFFGVAHMVAVSNGYPLDRTAFYIASDQPIARQKAAAYFGERGLRAVWDDGVSFGKDGARDSKAGLLGAIVEMSVLSRADEVVGSYGSSFSAVASSWGGIMRYDVRADGSYWYSGYAEPCWRFASRGHGDVVRSKGAADMVYHRGCHEGLSTFKGWQADKDFAVRT